MARRLPLTVFAATGLVALSIGCAVPAQAAGDPGRAASSSSSSQAAKSLAVPRAAVTIFGGEGSGEFYRVASVRLSGATPGAGYQVFNDTTGNEILDFIEVDENGNSYFQISIQPGVTNDIRVVMREVGHYDEPLTLDVHADDTRPELVKPTVTVSTQGGVTRLTATAPGLKGATYLHVKDVQGHFIAVEPMSDGSASVVLPATANETHYLVSQYNKLVSSPAEDVVVNAGVGSSTPVAPRVTVEATGARMVATAEGEKGATVTLRNSAGKVVAVRALNASGVASIALPASVEGEKLTATQTRSRLVSDATQVPVPTR